MSRLEFERKLNLGHLLTALSIVVSITGLLIAWSRDWEQRRRDRADQTRTAAAEALVKVLQWQDLSLYFFQDIQVAVRGREQAVRRAVRRRRHPRLPLEPARR